MIRVFACESIVGSISSIDNPSSDVLVTIDTEEYWPIGLGLCCGESEGIDNIVSIVDSKAY